VCLRERANQQINKSANQQISKEMAGLPMLALLAELSCEKGDDFAGEG
jgi:hypothetical protein